MASENPSWGQERIANELLVKLGIRISPRTVRKYMPEPVPGRPRGDQRWSTFLRNHAKAVVACDFFVAVTATFRVIYVFVVMHHSSRRLHSMSRSTQRPTGRCSNCGRRSKTTRLSVTCYTIAIRSSPKGWTGPSRPSVCEC